MSKTLTERTFFRYLKCPHWVYRDALVTDAVMRDPLLDRLLDDSLLPEKQREVLSRFGTISEVTAEDTDEAFLQTLQFMRDGRDFIYGARLVDGHWVGTPDVLAKVEGRSRLGTYYYVAADLKRMRVVRHDYMLQGAFYRELLFRIQGVRPHRGYVITPDANLLSYQLDEAQPAFVAAVHEVERLLAGEKPEHFLTSGCKHSPYFVECRDCTPKDDLALLNRVWQAEVDAVRAAKIKTITQLAGLSFETLRRRVPSLREDRLQLMHLQARAMAIDKPIFRAPVHLPQSSVEYYFDIESHPLRDQDYLFGVLVLDTRGERFEPLLSKQREDEEGMWYAFLTLTAEHPLAPIYHYGDYEKQVVLRFAARFGLAAAELQALMRRFVDIHETIRQSVVFPLSFYSLKDIAKFLGYTWKEAEATGAGSVLWAEEWMQHPRRTAVLKKILAYNEDDVRATRLVKEWLEKNVV